MASTCAVFRIRALQVEAFNAAGPNCFPPICGGSCGEPQSIRDRLTKTDPKLATLLDTFGRLTAGEHRPVRETCRRLRRPARRARRARRHFCRAGYGPAMLLLWLAISLTLIAIAVVLSHAAPG
jgi:hypothetical protein